MSWKETEDAVASVRIRRCNETIAKLIGGDPSKTAMPRVGVCLSGGGWRAMTSACALFDALSTPLAPSETIGNVGGVKLFDTISHAFGLSGGSWALFTTLAGGEVNPFHQSVDPRAPLLQHPWIYGQNNAFDENVHQYEGLAYMLSKDCVDRACYRSSAQQKVGFLSAKAGADTTIAAAMVSDKLGSTLVERWSNFIANDILSFVDVRAGVASNEADQPSTPSPVTGDAKAMDAHILAEANKKNASRNLHFGSLKPLIERGDLPFVVCSAIANRPRKADGPRPAANVRSYDWVEFTPWFSRNPPQNITCPETDRLNGYFQGVKTGPLSQLHMHNLMAICGSAFACDVACALPSGVSSLVLKHVEISSEPILGGGVTDVVEVGPDGALKAEFGICRDAGIDFNVPLPPMLSEAGRGFDIIIVHDAGAGSKCAFELHRAVELGYLQLMPGSLSPLDPFRPGECVRLFRGAGGFPSVIYFIGLTERGTHQIVHTASGLRKDVKRLRENVLKSLMPVLIGELRIAKARLDHGTLASVLPPPPPVLSVVRTTHMRRAIALDNEDEEEATALEQEEAEAAAASKQNRLAHPLNPLAEALVTNAMTAGKVNDALDAYLLIEHAIFNSVPTSKRLTCIINLQDRAIKTLTATSIDEVRQLPPITSIIDAPDLSEVLTEFGVLEKVYAQDPNRKEANLSPAWVDFYGMTALLSALFPDCEALGRVGIPPACAQDALAALKIFNHELPQSKIWNLIFIGLGKLQQLPFLTKVLQGSFASQVADALRQPVDASELTVLHMAEVLVDSCEEIGGDRDVILTLFATVCREVVAQVGRPTGGDAVAALATAAAARGKSIHLLQVATGTSTFASTIFQSPLAAEPPQSPLRDRWSCIVLDAVLENPSSSLRKQMFDAVATKLQWAKPTMAQCCTYALANTIKEYIPSHLDDRGSVTTLLQTQERHASLNNHQHRGMCIKEIWDNGVASNIFRDWIVEECVNGHQHYWIFLAPRVKEVKVPPTATPEKAKEAVEFADKCKRLQLINVPGNLAHGVRSKLGEIEGKLLTRKDAIAAKVGDVVSVVGDKAAAAKAIAIGKMGGLLGRFGK